jgi:hypothetical protein
MDNDIQKNVVKPLSVILKLAVYISTVIVSLAVGFSMTKGQVLNQSIPYLSSILDGIIVSIAGWIVIILTLVSIILTIVEKLKKY